MVLLVRDGQGNGPFDDESLDVGTRRVGPAVLMSLSGDVDMLTAQQLLPAVELCLVAAASGLVTLLGSRTPELSGLPAVYLLAVLPVALRWGAGPGRFASCLG